MTTAGVSVHGFIATSQIFIVIQSLHNIYKLFSLTHSLQTLTACHYMYNQSSLVRNGLTWHEMTQAHLCNIVHTS